VETLTLEFTKMLRCPGIPLLSFLSCFCQGWWSFSKHWPKWKVKLVHSGLLLFMKGDNDLGNKGLDLPSH